MGGLPRESSHWWEERPGEGMTGVEAEGHGRGDWCGAWSPGG